MKKKKKPEKQYVLASFYEMKHQILFSYLLSSKFAQEY